MILHFSERLVQFRAWNTVDECWEHFSFEDILRGEITVPMENLIHWEQNTGLKDRCRNLIYENNILKSRVCRSKPCSNCGHVHEKATIGVVVWADYDYERDYPNNFGAWCLNTGSSEFQLENTFEEYTIIGDYFRNPELKKQVG